jgi:hypothetical protein
VLFITPRTTTAHTAFVRFVSGQTVRPALAAGAVVVFASVLGCSDDREPEITKVRLDGKSYEIDDYVSCVRQLDGGLMITTPARAPQGTLLSGRDKKLVSVELLEDPRLVIEKAGIRFGDVRGFTTASEEMWGTKVDDVYTINGRMPSDDGTQWHQFTIEVRCSYIDDRFATRFGEGD